MRKLEDETKFKTIRVSQKGQIAIPSDIRREVGIKKGDELLLVKRGKRIMLEKPEEFAKKTKREFDDFADLLYWSEQRLKNLWLNKEDDIWDEYLKSGKK
jgi:AbrB family looped-hinge helix DNA binding protein